MNTMHFLHPYQHDGRWFFDDARAGVSRKPLVLGTDKSVGYLGQAFGDGKNFALVLSATKLPDAHAVLDRYWRMVRGMVAGRRSLVSKGVPPIRCIVTLEE